MAYQQRTSGHGAGGWSRTRRLVIGAIVVAVALVVILALAYGGGGGGSTGY